MAMKKRLPETVSSMASAIEKRLAGYGAMSVAIAAAVAPNAGAATVYWAPDVTTPVGGGVYFNVINGSTTSVASSSSLQPGAIAGEFALENIVGSEGFRRAFLVGSATNEFAVARAASSENLSPYPTSAARLAKFFPIGPGLSFNNPKRLTSVGGSSYPNNVFPSLANNDFAELGQWNALGSDFLGLTFQVDSQTDYGWALITINPNYTVTLDAMGYDDTGDSIPAGGAPEPNSMLLMALGASGLEAYRRKLANSRQKSSQ